MPVCPADSPGLQGQMRCCKLLVLCSQITHLLHFEEASGA